VQPQPAERSPRATLLVVRGAAAIAAGIAALLVPRLAAKTLLAAYLAFDGLLGFGLAARLRVRRRARLLIAFDAAVDLGVALLLFSWGPPGGVLVMIVAIWAMATGVMEIAAAIFLPRLPALAWTVALAGVTSCAVGVFALDWTDLAEIGLLYLFAAYALIVGILFAIVGVLLLREVRTR